MKKYQNVKPDYGVIWDQFEKLPVVQLQFGTKKEDHPLQSKDTGHSSELFFYNEYVEMKGTWDNSPEFGSMLKFKIKNVFKTSIRISKILFVAENGIDYFLRDYDPKKISFFQNGYQSWSATRSYRMKEVPFRSWNNFTNIMSDNTDNLASNVPGNLCSEMFAVISDLNRDDSFLVGQAGPFNQLFYIKLVLNESSKKASYFELAFDLGRKVLKPGEEIELDGIIIAQGKSLLLQMHYFSYLKKTLGINISEKNTKGWCTWYCFFDKITPEKILKNIKKLKEENFKMDYIQIDDGYEKSVGDWLDLIPAFDGRMKEITHAIREAGYKPAIWIAPFIADKDSKLAKIYPEFILRTETGKPVDAGFNPVWKGLIYYSLDVSNPLFGEYIQEVIDAYVNDWGFNLLKLDFMYGACMGCGRNQDYRLSRAELMKLGTDLIRKAAGSKTELLGCGLPLSPALGGVSAMRIGNDTAPYWARLSEYILKATSMVGAKNSLRNLFSRSMMNKKLWVNDPDCFIVRKTNTRLNGHERMTDINAKLLAGGIALLSDDFTDIKREEIQLAKRLLDESDKFYHESIPLDIMEREMPRIFYNKGGYIGFFNFDNWTKDITVDLRRYGHLLPHTMRSLKDFWGDERIKMGEDRKITFRNMPAHSSRLFQIEV